MYENTNSSIDWKGIFLKVIIAFLIIAIAFIGIKTFTKNKVSKKPVTTNVVESNSSTTFTANMDKLKEVGEKYYRENPDKLPEEGITSMVTLNDLIKAGVITSLTDADGKICDGESSYVTAEKNKNAKKDEDYTIKANLVCGESYSYVTTYLAENDTKVIETTNTVEINNGPATVNNNTNVSEPTKTCDTNCATTKTEVKQNVTINTNKNTSSNNTSNAGNTSNNTSNNVVSVPKRTYLVSYDRNGGSCNYSSTYVNEGNYVNNPGTCYRSGYDFLGWYLDGRLYDFNSPVTRDIKLIAQYSRNNNYYNDFDEDDYYNGYDRVGKDTVETLVYTMGWAQSYIDEFTITHTLDVENALDEIEDSTYIDRDDVTKIRISNIKYSQAIDTQTEAKKYRSLHGSTFLNSSSARVDESKTDKATSLAYVKSADFEFDNDYVNLTTAEVNGFEVTWSTDRITKSCSSPFSLNLGYDANLGYNNVQYNLCNFGIIYRVTWEYKYLY